MMSKRFNILLVEDNEEEAQLFEMALREIGPRLSLYWVATGDEAVEALQGRDRFKNLLGVDIVIMDVNLPGTDGFQTLERIRQDPALVSKPVIMMSSSRAMSDIQRGYKSRANSYVVKPITLDGLHETVRGLVRYWLELVELPEASV